MVTITVLVTGHHGVTVVEITIILTVLITDLVLVHNRDWWVIAHLLGCRYRQSHWEGQRNRQAKSYESLLHHVESFLCLFLRAYVFQ